MAAGGGFDDLLQHLDLLRVDLEFIPNIFSWLLVGIGLIISLKCHVQLLIKQTLTTHSFVAWGHASCTAGHLLWVTRQMKGTSMRQGVDAKEGVWLKLPALPCPLTEGMGELVLKQQKSLVPNVSSSSSSSSLDEAGLKVLENDLGGIGTTGGGNIRAQFLENISTMAWTMPANPHQSECFARMGRTHSSPIMRHTLI